MVGWTDYTLEAKISSKTALKTDGQNVKVCREIDRTNSNKCLGISEISSAIPGGVREVASEYQELNISHGVSCQLLSSINYG